MRILRFNRINVVFKTFSVLFAIYFVIQLFILMNILDYTKSVIFKKTRVIDDFLLINNLAEQIKFYVYLFDGEILTKSKNLEDLRDDFPGRVVVLAVDSKFANLNKLKKVTEQLEANDFKIEKFFGKNPFKISSMESERLIGFLLIRNWMFIMYVLYTQEDNTWWYGNLKNDHLFFIKTKGVGEALNKSFIGQEGLLTKFEAKPLEKHLSYFLSPLNVISFLKDFENSNFIACNISRAKEFSEKYKFDESVSAVRFRHRSWKLLSKIKTVFQNLSIPFWLSSGTCLGYFRECNIIPYSRDVDIGVFAKDYTEEIINQLEIQKIFLNIWLGEVEDSLELSFLDEYGSKLDVFFFYMEGDYFWNGGTQVKTGKKYKYIFPMFKLCWTLFLNIKLRIPCNTEEYIRSNYGPRWFIPQVHWDWKKSPFNVKENGIWPMEKRDLVIRQYD